MEKKHRCKLCFRNFANGRALGGHMRSHMMKFYAEERDSKQESAEEEEEYHFRSIRSYSSSSSLSSSDEEYDEEEEREAVRENRRKSLVLVNHDSVDGESETEWSKKKSISRRSKRIRKSRISDFNNNQQSSPLSSISDTTPEEHVAQCLIMLSRDKWEEEERDHLREEEDDDDDKMVKNIKFKGKYRCEECNKLFRSYQALGGHRANHNKIKAPPPPEKNGCLKEVAAVEAKLHQCPFCDRNFSSGQALGGHKRSHFVGANAISTNCSTISSQNSKIARVLNIDLNLPAPVEDDNDDDDESSQIAISTVSDAEFIH